MHHTHWLCRQSVDDFNNMKFPLDKLLRGSVFYPSAGMDGDPVKYLSKDYQSFIYADYGVERERVVERLERVPLKGYELIVSRDVSSAELAPNGWRPSPPDFERENPRSRADCLARRPYCLWMIFERAAGYDAAHGPKRLSLLYICADGAATYQALYWKRRISPAVLAIIQPGAGFGGNYTHFDDRRGHLGRTVMDGPINRPKRLLYGGCGSFGFYKHSCWPEYGVHIDHFQKFNRGQIGCWELGVEAESDDNQEYCLAAS